jgi:hypothetical protein
MENNIKYGIVLYWSKEDQAFIAAVPELRGGRGHVSRGGDER